MNDERRSLLLALSISLICHVLLLWFLPHMQGRPVQPEQKIVLAVKLASPPAPPPPAEPAPPPVATPQPTSPQRAPALTRSTPAPVAIAPAPVVEEPPPPLQPASPSLPSPPRHQMKAASGRSAEGSRRGTARSGSGSGSGNIYAPPDYAEKVKTRVNAAIVYPADAKRFLQQCWVEYTLTVDRNGNLLNYRIENCGDDRLDAAAQAALIKGGPYPPPPSPPSLPDGGAASYEIHGALVFTLQ